MSTKSDIVSDSFKRIRMPELAESYQVYVMYHATKTWENVESILQNGFTPSVPHHNMLGSGIYASRDIKKTRKYGDFAFKLLVYTGKSFTVECQEEPRRKKWQILYDSAWVPPHCGMVASGREEHCIINPRHIKILGLVRGFDQLPIHVRVLTASALASKIKRLEPWEQEILEDWVWINGNSSFRYDISEHRVKEIKKKNSAAFV